MQETTTIQPSQRPLTQKIGYSPGVHRSLPLRSALAARLFPVRGDLPVNQQLRQRIALSFPCTQGFTRHQPDHRRRDVGIFPARRGSPDSIIATVTRREFSPCTQGFTPGILPTEEHGPVSPPARGGSPHYVGSGNVLHMGLPRTRGFTVAPGTSGLPALVSSPFAGDSPCRHSASRPS